MMEAGHSCGSKEVVDEVETEDQMEFEVSEDNASDSDLEEEKTVSESFANLFKKLAFIAEESTENTQQPELVELPNGNKYWHLNDKLHRTDGPAIEYLDGTKYWYLDDKLHREDGPAIELADGRKGWFINGRRSKGPASRIKMDEASAGPGLGSLMSQIATKHPEATAATLAIIAGLYGAHKLKDLYRLRQRRTELANTIGSKSNQWLYANRDHYEHGDIATKEIERRKSSDNEKKLTKEKVEEWANNAGPGKTVSDTTFEQDIDFMTQVISGGLNKPKSTGQTTSPVIAGQADRMGNPKETVNESVSDWVKLAEIK
jgi:hypothetical protein